MRKVLLAVAAVVVVVAGAALPAGAGIGMDYELTMTPSSGETGTVVTFTSVDECPNLNTGVPNAPGDSFGALSRVAEPSAGDFVADTITEPDGSWSLTYEIPADEPVGEVTFYGFCLYETNPPDLDGTTAAIPDDYFVTAEYTPVVFTVTAPPPSSTTTVTGPPGTTIPAPPTPPAPTLVASPTSVFPGDTIAVTASGFKPGSSVVITLESDPVNLGSYVADSAGRIATNIVVPADFPAGAHTLKLTGTDIAGSILVLSTGITVGSRIQVTTTAAPSSGTLPQTGSSFTEPALLVGGALVLGGAVAVVAARRRRATTR